MPLKYKYIFLDADETLFDFDTSEYNAFRETTLSYGYPFTDELYDEYHLVNKSLWEEFELGKVTKAFLTVERFRRVIDAHGIAADRRSFQGATRRRSRTSASFCRVQKNFAARLPLRLSFIS